MSHAISDLLIGVVGVCASGKSTLVKGLTQRGFTCRHIAQEHSYIQDMWKRITKPDILIFLDVAYETTLKRKNLNWTKEEYHIQLQRLQHARQHAHIRIDTNALTPEDLVSTAIAEIESLIGGTREDNHVV